MKVDRVTVRIADLRTTQKYQNKRVEVEVTSKVEDHESPDSVFTVLKGYCNNYINECFVETPDEMKKELGEYRKRYGRLD